MKRNLRKSLLVMSIIGVISLTTLTGCNSSAKYFGGTTNIDLPKGKKLLNASWKDDDIWYLTRDMNKDEKAETYEYVQQSNMGIVSGKVVIKESK